MNNSMTTRVALYSFILSTILVPLSIELSQPNANLSWQVFAIWLLVSALLVSLLENMLSRRTRKITFEQIPDAMKVVTGGSQAQLLERVNSHALDIDQSPSVDLLSDTLKSFTDSSENLSALKRLLAREGQLRILLIDPNSEHISTTVRARQDNGRNESTKTYSEEIRQSLRRLSQCLTRDQMRKHIRLYRYPAFYASYIMANNAYVTIFTHGRGGSSPSLYLSSDGAHQQFFSGLVRGFGELWEASNTLSLDAAALDALLDH